MGEAVLWIGRAGSGKSQRIADMIAKDVEDNPLGGKIFWIVPETVSFAAERKMVAAVGSTVRAEVLSLPRLALRIQNLMRVASGNPVNTTGQRLILAQVLREAAPQLSVLHRAKPTLSFLDSILEAFEDMSANLVSMEQIESTLQIASTQVDATRHPLEAHAGRSLLGKLGDLCTLYFLYQRALQERNLYDPSELMERVHPSLEDCPILSGATLYLDGFREMQPRELNFALGLAKVADKTIVAVTGDPLWASSGRPTGSLVGSMSLTELVANAAHPGDVFAPESLRLVLQWFHGCSRMGIAASALGLAPPEGSDMLHHLEQNLFSKRQGEGPWSATEESRQHVRIAAAQNMRAESEGIAKDILSHVYEGHYSFRDMMIVVPNLSDYAPLLREVLTKHQIDFDLADPPLLNTHPLSKFILGALAVVEEDFSLTSVLRVLKTDFCGLDREDADWLEGYLVSHQIAGMEDWTGDWSYKERSSDRPGDTSKARFEDDRANRLRQAVGAYLIPFARLLQKPECTPREVAEALWGLLEAVRAKRRVAAWVVDEGNAEDPHAASVHEQAWQRILGVLNDLNLYAALSLFTEALLPRRSLFESIRTDINRQTLSAVPAGMESVLVTDVERASALHLPVVYLMGLTDGVLPRRTYPLGLLQDEERVQFAVLFGQRLGDTAEDRQFAEQSRVYMALTRATEMLTLSYPMANADGKELRSASVINRVHALFDVEDLSVLWFAEGLVENVQNTVWTPATALQWLLSVLRDAKYGQSVPPGTTAVYRWLFSHEVYSKRLQSALFGLFHKTSAESLSPAVATGLFGNPLRVNVYQLETFASCPYRHFAQYGLRLAEPPERDATRAERGTLIHALLAEFVEKWRENPDGWREMSDAEAQDEMAAVFSQLLRTPQFDIWLRSRIRRQQALEALLVAKRAAISLTRHARYSRFVPAYLELSFGTGDEGSYPAYGLTLSDGTEVQLRGRIDRIDVAEEDGQHRFRVIDYKSRTMDIDLGKVYHGLRLQLPVYSAVVRAESQDVFGKASKAGGFFYLPLVRKFESSNQPEDEATAELRALTRMRARGLWRNDGVSLGWMDLRLPNATDSELFPKMYKKDGSVTKQAPVLEDADWERMERFVLAKVGELASGIRSGNNQIAPYALGRQDIACRTCSYAAICQFDSRWDQSPLRPLQKQSKDAVLSVWAETQGGDRQ